MPSTMLRIGLNVLSAILDMATFQPFFSFLGSVDILSVCLHAQLVDSDIDVVAEAHGTMRAYSGAITGLEDLSAVNFGSNSEDILGCCLMFLFPERLLQEERDVKLVGLLIS
ncbi:hypothetical protein RRG08_058808 [Elysia crispata]|uniref:Uncharacterized protein n=1 Tax=Elysia crispata TaxID=231223 RepID=A0AAE0YWT5_9GAST|nr:hypothetical protein RRG08_058808 [Elysia crispata]